MQHRRSRKLLAVAMASVVILAACGDDEESTSTTGATETTAGESPETTAGESPETTAGESPETTAGESGGSLAGLCPDTVVIQTDWMPQAEHGFLYQMVGEGYEIDAGNGYVTGPLIDETGADTGVDIQIRSGGPAQNFSPVSSLMYTNEDITLGYVYTDEAIQFSAEFPTVAIMSGFEKNPQMIMWDPETYPEVEGIADLGELGVKIRYFGGAAYMDFLTGSGILSTDQTDGSYTGDPSLFVTDEGSSAQQGFGSAEPYLYANEVENWMKPVAYEYINDIGWENYAESIATKPENITELADCFEILVPIIQHASIDYVNDPARTNEIILAAVSGFGEDFGWSYSEAAAAYGVSTMLNDGLVANGSDGVMGSFDLDRVAGLIEIAVPIYEAKGSSPKEGVTPEDIVTNQFIDTSISL